MNLKHKFQPNIATGFLSDEDTKKYFSRIGYAVFGLVLSSSLVSLGLALVYALLAKYLAPVLMSNTNYYMIISNIISLVSIYGVGLPVFLTITSPLPKMTPYKAKIDAKGCISGAFIAILFLYLGNSISSIILNAIESVMNITTQNPIGESVEQSSLLTTIIFTVILAPILEEILFRKIVCDRLLPLGEGYAIFVSAAIFGLIHGNFYQFAYAFLLGVFFAFIYIKTGKLIYSMAYHMLVNFIGAVLPLLLQKIVDVNLINSAIEAMSRSQEEFIKMLANPALVRSIYILFLYEVLMMACYIVGIVMIFNAKKKNLLKIESGILPPPKECRFQNIFLTSGVAASIAIFLFTFIFSLIQ